MTALFKGLRTVSFFDFGTFFLFAEESDELPVPKSRLLWDGVLVVGGWMLRDELPVVEGRALSAGVRMLQDEIRAVESRVLSDGVACAAVRILRDELPVVEGWTLSGGVAGVGVRMP